MDPPRGITRLEVKTDEPQIRSERVLIPLAVTVTSEGRVQFDDGTRDVEKTLFSVPLLQVWSGYWQLGDRDHFVEDGQMNDETDARMQLVLTTDRVRLVGLSTAAESRRQEKRWRKRTQPWFLRALDFSFTDVVDVMTGDIIASKASDALAGRAGAAVDARNDRKRETWQLSVAQCQHLWVTHVSYRASFEGKWLEVGVRFKARARGRETPYRDCWLRAVTPMPETGASELVTSVRNAVLDRKLEEPDWFENDPERRDEAYTKLRRLRGEPVEVQATKDPVWFDCGVWTAARF